MATLLIPQCMDGFANWRFHSYGKTTTVIPVTIDTGETPPLLPGCVFSQESSSSTLGVNGDMELGEEEEQGAAFANTHREYKRHRSSVVAVCVCECCKCRRNFAEYERGR